MDQWLGSRENLKSVGFASKHTGGGTVNCPASWCEKCDKKMNSGFYVELRL